MPITDNHNKTIQTRGSLAGRIVRWIFVFFLGVVLLACTVLVALFSFEQSTLRPLAERAVTQITGRAFSIEGNLDAHAGRIVTVRADRIRLANADWGSSDDMLTIEGVEISLDLLPLLDGILAIDNVMVSSGKILSEQDGQGRSNWTMDASDGPSPVRATDPNDLPLLLAHAELSNIDITVKSSGLTRALDIRLESVVQDTEQDDDLSLVVKAVIEDHPVNLQGRIGPLKNLLGKREVELEFKGDFDVFSINANGRLDNLLEPKKSSLHITFEAVDAQQISTMFALPEVVSGALEFDVKLVPDGDHHRLDIAGSIGALDLNGNARLQALDTLDGSSINLITQGPDLASIAKLAGLVGLPSKPFRFESSLELAGKHLQIGETQLDTGDNHLTLQGAMNQFPKLAGTNLNLQFYGKNYLEFSELLGLTEKTGLKPAPFKVQGDLEYSALDQQTFSAQLALGDISGEFDGMLTEYPRFVGSHLKYRIHAAHGADLLRLLDRPLLIEEPLTVEGEVRRTQAGINIDRSILSLGENELDVSGLIGEDPLRRDSNLSVRYRGPDLGKVAAIAGYAGFVPGGVATINAAVRAQSDGIHLDSLDVELGRNKLKGSGLIGMQSDLAGSRVSVSISGEDIAEVLPAGLLDYVAAQQSFELSSTLASSSGQLAIDSLEARLGEVQLRASGIVSMDQPHSNTRMKIDIKGPNFAAIIPEQLVASDLPQEEFSVTGGVGLNQNGLALDTVKVSIGATRLELFGTIPLDASADGLDLTIAANGPNLDQLLPIESDQFDIRDLAFKIDGHVQLADGILSVRQLSLSTSRGSIAGSLGIALDDPGRFGQFDLKSSGDNLEAFFPAMPEYRPAAVPFDLNARGSWDTKKINIDKGVLELDDSRIEAQGEIDLSSNMTATRLVFSARGDSLAHLGQIQGLVLPPDRFNIEASLQGNTRGLGISKLTAVIGESDLGGSLSIEFADKPNIALELNSRILDLARFLPPEDDSAEVAPPPSKTASDGLVIPERAVPTELLNSMNMETNIDIEEMRLPNNVFRNVDIIMTLQEGDFVVKQFNATAAEGKLVARLQMVANDDRIATSGALEGTDIVLGDNQPGDQGNSLPEQDFYIEFETEGSTVRELAGNLNGYAQITGAEGRLKNGFALGLFGSFFQELIGAINPFAKKEPYTTISCFAAYAEIIDGVATINPGAVMQTDKLDMFTRGQIDLKTEQVNLRFDTIARKGIGVSVADFVNPFVGVSGTFAQPKLGLDSKNAMFEGGFAYATGGLSIVLKGMYGRWFGIKDPCVQFEKQAETIMKTNKLGKHREQDP